MNGVSKSSGDQISGFNFAEEMEIKREEEVKWSRCENFQFIEVESLGCKKDEYESTTCRLFDETEDVEARIKEEVEIWDEAETVSGENVYATDDPFSEDVVNDEVKDDFASECNFSSNFEGGAEEMSIKVEEVSIFCCQHCEKSFTSEEDLNEHSKLHNDSDLLKCRDRNMFASMKVLKGHLKQHENTTEFRCLECKRYFGSRQSLKAHLKVHRDPNASQCPECGKHFYWRHSLNEHLQLHRNPLCAPFRCTKCNKVFSLDSSLQEHLKEHISPDAFKGQVCQQLMNTRNGSEIHNVNVVKCLKCQKSVVVDCMEMQINSSAFECYECKELLVSNEGYNFIEQLEILNSLKCLKCEKMFSCRQNLDQHLELHKNPSAFQCLECGKLFYWKHDLREHLKYHNDPNHFECRPCNVSFTSKKQMKEHLQNHSNPNVVKYQEFGKNDGLGLHRDLNGLKCPQCGKIYSTKQSLNYHLKMHKNPNSVKRRGRKTSTSKKGLKKRVEKHDKKSFKCTECNKLFISKHGLNGHVKVHKDSKTLKCK